MNGQRVRGVEGLRVDDEMSIGQARFRFEGAALLQYEQRPRVRLDAVDLVYGTRPGPENIILHNVSLTVLPQEFVDLMCNSIG